jgi:signal peptidase I
VPTFRTGDLAVTLRQTTYRVGDVVVYHVPRGEPGAGTEVIHRVVGGSGEDGYRMKGDNKQGIDPWRPRSEDVVGKVRVAVPRAGLAILFLRSAWGMALIAGLTTLLVALAVAPSGRDSERNG